MSDSSLFGRFFRNNSGDVRLFTPKAPGAERPQPLASDVDLHRSRTRERTRTTVSDRITHSDDIERSFPLRAFEDELTDDAWDVETRHDREPRAFAVPTFEDEDWHPESDATEHNAASSQELDGDETRFSWLDDEADAETNEPRSVSAGAIDLDRARQRKLVDQTAQDLDTLDENLTQNSFHLNHARDQLKSLRDFIQQADVEFDEVHRLRRHLGEQTQARESADHLVQATRRDLDTTRNALSTSETRNVEFRKALEQARREILSLMDQDRKQREEIEDLHALATQREAEILEANRLADKLLADNRSLNECNERLANDLSSSIKSATELEKQFQEVTDSVTHWKREADRSMTDLSETTDKLDATEAELLATQAKLDSTVAETTETHRSLQDRLRMREDELFSMRSRIDAVRSELRVKAEMAAKTAEDLRMARTEARLAKEQVAELSEQLASEVAQRETDRTRLSEANAEISDVNDRFSDLLADLETSRRESTLLKRRIRVERQRAEFDLETLDEDVPSGDVSRHETVGDEVLSADPLGVESVSVETKASKTIDSETVDWDQLTSSTAARPSTKRLVASDPAKIRQADRLSRDDKTGLPRKRTTARPTES
ncbi:MAG: hypothetical protein AAFX39_01295 [Pseudomonadota bacterium]